MNFPTTHWSLLAQASWDGSSSSRKALEALCGRYWGPIHRFIRCRVRDPEAQDLTQEFMLHLLQKSFFERADRMRGRFRSFLLGALARFLADAADKREALKRGGAQVHFDWASAEAGNGHEVSCPPEIAQVFDREWALTMLECALARVREEYSRQRPQHVFAVLQRFLPGSARPPSYEEAAQQLGVSLGALRSEVHRLRGRLRMLLREEVAQTVSAPHEIEPEMGHLRRVLMEDSSGLPPDPKYEVLEF